MPDVLLRPSSHSAFSPFGTLVEMGRPAVSTNNGTALRHDIDSVPAFKVNPKSALVTSIFEAEGLSLPRTVIMLERHPGSQQLIMPISSSGHVVVVCQNGSDDAPDLRTLAAFHFTGRQGMIYRPGAWHHPILALGGKSLFLVQSWQNGDERDCEVATILPTVIGSNCTSE
jgi:ureidoglycolate lyase